jgi:hypothetical protein
LIGWLVAGWFTALFIAITVWHNTSWARSQRRTAQQRPGLDRDAYAAEMDKSGASKAVSQTLYDCIKRLCVKGVQPHPDDGLFGFYFDEGEDLEDLIEELFENWNSPCQIDTSPRSLRT